MNGKQLTISFITLLMCAFLIRETTFSQANTSSKANTASSGLYIEVIGQSCSYLSINYDLIFSITTSMKHRIAIRAGLGHSIFWHSIPFTVSYVTGRNHNLELGVGLVHVGGHGWDGDYFKWTALTALIGYRYQRPQGGFVFRIGFTPLFKQGEKNIIPLGGLSLGFAL